MKISGIGLPSVPWRAENNRLIVETLFEAFGSQRIMFELPGGLPVRIL